ncbi:MAG: hypothetical protein ACFFB2_02030 [Promethearchaeota archaeon]
MSVQMNSFLKSIIVTIIITIASVGSTLIINPNAIFVPQHQFDFELTDVREDVNDSYVDIIKYGSFKQGKNVVLYLEVATLINLSSLYRLFIVAKTTNDNEAHIYNNEVQGGTEQNYQSEVIIDGNRLEVFFSTDRFISNSYMVGIEAGAHSFASEDSTPSARDNPLKTRFLGLI